LIDVYFENKDNDIIPTGMLIACFANISDAKLI